MIYKHGTKRVFIYTRRNMMPSALALASLIQHSTGARVKVTTRSSTTLRGKCIRWGNSDPLDLGQESVNSAELIGVCANKYSFSNEMVSLGIPNIELHDSSNGSYPDHYPVVVRDTLTGYGGAGIHICQDADEWYPFRYRKWSYYRTLSPELGVHIFNRKIIKVFKKEWIGEGDEPKFKIRNSVNGYHFSLVSISNFPKLVVFMENFMEKFPILFGRLDVGWDKEDKTYRAIEFNTAPGIANNPDTASEYARRFLDLI